MTDDQDHATMADHKDIATAIHSALEELGVDGVLKVKADGSQVVTPVGEPSGDAVAVTVLVEPVRD